MYFFTQWQKFCQTAARLIFIERNATNVSTPIICDIMTYWVMELSYGHLHEVLNPLICQLFLCDMPNQRNSVTKLRNSILYMDQIHWSESEFRITTEWRHCYYTDYTGEVTMTPLCSDSEFWFWSVYLVHKQWVILERHQGIKTKIEKETALGLWWVALDWSAFDHLALAKWRPRQMPLRTFGGRDQWHLRHLAAATCGAQDVWHLGQVALMGQMASRSYGTCLLACGTNGFYQMASGTSGTCAGK